MKFANLLFVSISIILLNLSCFKNNSLVDESLTKLENELKIYINEGENAKISSVKEIYFGEEIGYFFGFKNKEEKLESLIIKGDFENYEVLFIYDKNDVPINEGEKYFISPFEFSVENPFLEKKINLNTQTFNVIDYEYPGIDLNGVTIDSNSYFKINNISSKQYKYLSSYLTEVKMKNVPNYMNNQFNNNGCFPTSFAMFLLI